MPLTSAAVPLTSAAVPLTSAAVPLTSAAVPLTIVAVPLMSAAVVLALGVSAPPWPPSSSSSSSSLPPPPSSSPPSPSPPSTNRPLMLAGVSSRMAAADVQFAAAAVPFVAFAALVASVAFAALVAFAPRPSSGRKGDPAPGGAPPASPALATQRGSGGPASASQGGLHSATAQSLASQCARNASHSAPLMLAGDAHQKRRQTRARGWGLQKAA